MHGEEEQEQRQQARGPEHATALRHHTEETMGVVVTEAITVRAGREVAGAVAAAAADGPAPVVPAESTGTDAAEALR